MLPFPDKKGDDVASEYKAIIPWNCCRSLMRREWPREHDGVRRNNAMAFPNGDELIGLDLGNSFLTATWPNDLQAKRGAVLRFAKSEGKRQLALR
jgi:hypothetical protein